MPDTAIVTATADRVRITVPRAALVDPVCALAKEVHAGSPILEALHYLASAGRKVTQPDDEREESYDAACNEHDQALADVLDLLGDIDWTMTPQQAEQLAARVHDATLEARGLFECPCGAIGRQVDAVWDDMRLFARCGQDCSDAAAEHAQAGAQ